MAEVRDVKAAIREAWQRSDSGTAFSAALEEKNLMLAMGDSERKPFGVVDEHGQFHVLTRTLDAKAKEVRGKLGDLDKEKIPTVEQAREGLEARHQAQERARQERERQAAAAQEQAQKEKEWDSWIERTRAERARKQERAREQAQAREREAAAREQAKPEREPQAAAQEQEPAKTKEHAEGWRAFAKERLGHSRTDAPEPERQPATPSQRPDRAEGNETAERTTAPRREPERHENTHAASEPRGRFRVFDKASGIGSGVCAFAATVLDGIAAPVEGLAEGICNLFGASPAPREPTPEPRPVQKTTLQILQERDQTRRAMKNISASVKRGDDLNAADLRVLPRTELERIRDGGDEYLMRMVKRFERERDDRGRERER